METATQKKPKVKVKLTGEDGNVFNLIGICTRAMKKAGQHEEARAMSAEIFNSSSYDEALAIMMRYCDVR